MIDLNLGVFFELHTAGDRHPLDIITPSVQFLNQ